MNGNLWQAVATLLLGDWLLGWAPRIALFGLDWLAYGMCTLTNVEIPLLMLNGHRNAKLKGQYGVVLVGLLLGDRLCY